jgi:hypothetical protein
MRPLRALSAAFVIAACSVAPSPSPNLPSSPSASPPGSPAVKPTFNAPVGTIDPSTDNVVQSVIADASRVMDRKQEEFVVVRAERGTWPDSSLGCAFPNVAYDQVLTEGYWVVLAVAGIEIDYRVSLADGEKSVCTIPGGSRQGPIE